MSYPPPPGWVCLALNDPRERLVQLVSNGAAWLPSAQLQHPAGRERERERGRGKGRGREAGRRAKAHDAHAPRQLSWPRQSSWSFPASPKRDSLRPPPPSFPPPSAPSSPGRFRGRGWAAKAGRSGGWAGRIAGGSRYADPRMLSRVFRKGKGEKIDRRVVVWGRGPAPCVAEWPGARPRV